MSALQHTPTSTERDMIDSEKPGLTQTISSGAVSMSPELFEKVWTDRKAGFEADLSDGN